MIESGGLEAVVHDFRGTGDANETRVRCITVSSQNAGDGWPIERSWEPDVRDDNFRMPALRFTDAPQSGVGNPRVVSPRLQQPLQNVRFRNVVFDH